MYSKVNNAAAPSVKVCESSRSGTAYKFLSSLAVCLLVAAVDSTADSIRVNGELIEGVFVRSGSSMYYVQNPKDGSTVSVPRAHVKCEDVVLTRSRAERKKLLDAWRSKQDSSGVNAADRSSTRSGYEARKAAILERLRESFKDPTTSLVLEREQAERDRIEREKNEVVAVTNRPELLKRRPTRRYVDKDGVVLATNVPGRVRDLEDYVVVIIEYDPIEVPVQFRGKTSWQGFEAQGLDDIVHYYARGHGLDPNLVYAVITAESNGDQNAVSRAGASGLMQLMPGTALEMGVKNIFDPVQNVAGGTQYLAKLIKLFENEENTLTLALAAYNAGPGNVKKYNGVPPFRETREYVKRVQRHQNRYARSGPPKYELTVAKAMEID